MSVYLYIHIYVYSYILIYMYIYPEKTGNKSDIIKMYGCVITQDYQIMISFVGILASTQL